MHHDEKWNSFLYTLITRCVLVVLPVCRRELASVYKYSVLYHKHILVWTYYSTVMKLHEHWVQIYRVNFSYEGLCRMLIVNNVLIVQRFECHMPTLCIKTSKRRYSDRKIKTYSDYQYNKYKLELLAGLNKYRIIYYNAHVYTLFIILLYFTHIYFIILYVKVEKKERKGGITVDWAFCLGTFWLINITSFSAERREETVWRAANTTQEIPGSFHFLYVSTAAATNKNITKH